ncbi:MAG: L,D-transpeptidase, partial [Deltaproteobacteria bacterium]|nr:L,D-transpeptidase [Nannocystaceae bacterium]
AAPGGELSPWRIADASGSYTSFPPMAVPIPALDGEAEAEFPKHGLVTSLAVIVRQRAELAAPIMGILRGGTRVRVDAERSFGGGCSQGWHKVYPRGWICLAAGLSVGSEPPQDQATVVDPDLTGALPYEYWRVNAEMTPFFHRLPSFGEQDAADHAGQAWLAEKGKEPMPTASAERPEEVPAVVKEYMNAGFYVTKAGEEVKSERRFLRTTRGSYARKYQLGQKAPTKYQGKLVGEEGLPIYFIRREMPLMRREPAGSDVLVKTETMPERLGTWPFVRKLHVGTVDYFEDKDGLLMRAYAVGEAYKLKRPPSVAPGEHWVHIDLSEQVLVAYDGDTPVFATLVSTGKTPGMTPVGVHRVQMKHVATSMRDQPIEDEAYSIDDVPWTQYFQGSVALHGAFWHAGFGIERSHGCVNLSPADARWLFGFTEPGLPEGWHAISPTGRSSSPNAGKGSAIVVTE